MGACNSTNNKHSSSPRRENKPVQHKINHLNTEDKTILNLKLCRDNIKNYIKKLETSESKTKQKAKDELKKKDREKAKMYLSRSKLYHEQRNIAQGQLNMIEDQAMAIESAKNQREAMTVLQQGNEILKKLNEEVNVEKWENIADDMKELKQQQDEIGDFLKNHNIDEGQYEEQLNKELENLMQSVAEPLDLPSASNTVHKPVEKGKEETKENVNIEEEKVAVPA
jgi:charged multivesicular body protein 6